jgi:hypothetical protein
MSAVPAMTNERRLNSYLLGSGRRVLTPAQHRRIRHKVRHAYASRNPQPRREQRHDLEGLVAHWDEQQRKPKVPSPDQLERLDAVQERHRADAPRKMNISWPKRFGRRGE